MMAMALIVLVVAIVVTGIDQEKEIRRQHLSWKQW